MVVEATPKAVKQAIMKYSPHPEFDETKRKKIKATVCCHGCGKEISTEGDLTGIDFVITKRGTSVFFHHRCRRKVWGRKIPV